MSRGHTTTSEWQLAARPGLKVQGRGWEMDEERLGLWTGSQRASVSWPNCVPVEVGEERTPSPEASAAESALITPHVGQSRGAAGHRARPWVRAGRCHRERWQPPEALAAQELRSGWCGCQ